MCPSVFARYIRQIHAKTFPNKGWTLVLMILIDFLLRVIYIVIVIALAIGILVFIYFSCLHLLWLLVWTYFFTHNFFFITFLFALWLYYYNTYLLKYVISLYIWPLLNLWHPLINVWCDKRNNLPHNLAFVNRPYCQIIVQLLVKFHRVLYAKPYYLLHCLILFACKKLNLTKQKKTTKQENKHILVK